MKYYLLTGISLIVFVSYAQRLEGWDVRTDDGTRFDALIGSGLASFQWGQLRGSANVPPLKIKRVWGKLTARLTRQTFFYDSTCGCTFNLILTPLNGDAGNWINGELYALCQEASFTRVNVEVRSIVYDGASGMDHEPSDPRNLFQFTRSQWVELILHGDVNNDGCVDDADLLQVLIGFGQGGDSPADQNGDGVVDDSDLLIVLANFGRCY